MKTSSEINPPLQGYLPIIKNLSSLENCTSEEESCGERDTTGSELHFNYGKYCPKPKKVTNFIGEIEEIIEVQDSGSVMAKCFFSRENQPHCFKIRSPQAGSTQGPNENCFAQILTF